MKKMCPKYDCEPYYRCFYGGNKKANDTRVQCPENTGPNCEIVKPKKPKEKGVRVKAWAYRIEMMPSVGEWRAREDKISPQSVPCYILVRKKDMGRIK